MKITVFIQIFGDFGFAESLCFIGANFAHRTKLEVWWFLRDVKLGYAGTCLSSNGKGNEGFVVHKDFFSDISALSNHF